MLHKVEHYKRSDSDLYQKIEQEITPELLRMAKKIAEVVAEEKYAQTKIRCEEKGEACLPPENFFKVALKEKLREMLGIKSGSVESFIFNDWWSKNNAELLG